jgi:hypothetical protein
MENKTEVRTIKKNAFVFAVLTQVLKGMIHFKTMKVIFHKT